jgi:hypothetical protein
MPASGATALFSLRRSPEQVQVPPEAGDDEQAVADLNAAVAELVAGDMAEAFRPILLMHLELPASP